MMLLMMSKESRETLILPMVVLSLFMFAQPSDITRYQITNESSFNTTDPSKISMEASSPLLTSSNYSHLPTTAVRQHHTSLDNTSPVIPYFKERVPVKLMFMIHVINFCKNQPHSFKHYLIKLRLCRKNNPISPFQKKTLYSCFREYRQLYGDKAFPSPFTFSLGPGTSVKIYRQEPFVSMCLPNFQRNNLCIERKYMTFCFDEMIVFLHSQSCTPPSDEDKHFDILLAYTNLVMDYDCFQNICNGFFRIIERNINGIRVIVWRLVNEKSKCQYLIHYKDILKFFVDESRVRFVITGNLNFPCCYAMHYAMWLGDPEAVGLNVFWDYLPFWCRAGEIILTAFVASIGIIGTLGNLLIVVVMFKSDQWDASRIFRTSLAFSDLLTSVFVVIPAFVDHLRPIIRYSDFQENYLISEYVKGHKETILSFSFKQLIPITYGFRIFQGLIFGMCSLVSLLTLFLLSVERFIITGRALHYKDYFTVHRVKFLLILIWITAFMDTLFFMFDGKSSLEVTFSTLLKLPISISGGKFNKELQWLTSFQIILLSLLCTSTIIISVISVGIFTRKQIRVREKWRRMNMRVSGPFQKENRYILVSLCMLSLLFMISTMLRGIVLIFIQLDFRFPNDELVDYFSWWIFLSGNAWNPMIYNMRSQEFKQEVNKTLHSMIPVWLKKKMGSSGRDTKTREEESQMRMLKKLNLIYQ
ncbi:uncharacterized protein LOC125028843 [Penaeus chinensis]|uniref:uncharacterized protein LOC125028843 n=1 Tax=Penaeus chinensis TaxID=139456 RepID=UPI001FB5AAA9|nr:uncharacterized protein LOC125028843 [Penaeus chinensis]